MKRAKQNDIPAKKPARNSGIFQKQPRASKPDYEFNHKLVGDDPRGLTTNRQKPGGGSGSSGKITNVG